MIDTVELRFHDITGAHNRLAEFLNRNYSGTGKTVTMSPGTDEPPSVTAQVLHRKYIHFHDSGNVHQVAHFNELKSSHYTIAYKIDTLREFILINLSIPKYVFGTNIIHYNRPVTDKAFSTAHHSELKRNLKESYKRLYHFLGKFFALEFGEIEIDYQLVEVSRIDICYNQMFDSKDASLDYLNQLRKLKKKYARDASNYSRDWKTSIVYKTDRYSFKVYHKGTEFAKNDAKNLRELNEAGKSSFDVAYYQRFADRILRYEMTFRNSHMSYLYMAKLFRKDCHIWEAGVKLWKKAKQKKSSGADSYMTFRKGLTIEEKKLIDYVNGIVSKNKKFYLNGNTASDTYDLETDLYTWAHWPTRRERFDGAATLSPELWSVLSKAFLTNLGEFQLAVHEDSHSVMKKFEVHNARVLDDRKKYLALGLDKKSPRYKELGEVFYLSAVRSLLEMLETKTFEEIEESQVFNRTTWWRWRKVLAEFGVTQNHQLSVAVRSDMDLQAYNTELLFNSSKFVQLAF